MGLKKRFDVLVTDFEPNLLGRDLIEMLCVLKVNNVSVFAEEQKLNDILEKHKVVFTKELGKMKGVKAKIHVNGEVKPIFYKPRSLAYAMQEKVNNELNRLENENVIKRVKFSDWAAPVVPVLKSNGEIRLCGDYKVTVNRVSRLEQYPIPTLEEIMNRLGQGSVYHKLDLSQAYTQLELDTESQQYTTINTHKGLYQYKRLPFGIASAPAIFQRIIEMVLIDIPSVAVYLDDILVTGVTVEES